MTENNDKQLAKTLKKAFPPVDADLRRDLWPAVLRRLDAPPVAVPWYDWALLGLAGGVFLFFPRFILVFVYHL